MKKKKVSKKSIENNFYRIKKKNNNYFIVQSRYLFFWADHKFLSTNEFPQFLTLQDTIAAIHKEIENRENVRKRDHVKYFSFPNGFEL